MNFLRTLPWCKEYIADNAFYDPGLKPPPHRLFRQAGDTTLATPGGAVDCWIVAANHNICHVVSCFCIDKNTQPHAIAAAEQPALPPVL